MTIMQRLVGTVLRHAPHWLLDLIEKMLERDSPMLRWIKARAAAGVPVPEPMTPRPDASTRVFVGPFNYAGQAWQWARDLRESDASTDARNLTVTFPNDLGFPSDDRVPAAVFAGSSSWRHRQREAFGRYTHVVIESFTSTYGAGRNRGLLDEVQWHTAEGRRVALLCHGTDIRSPHGHAARSRFSPFDLSDRGTQRLERRVVENKLVMAELGVPVFYSTPDLVHDVPDGAWLPLVIDPEPWAAAARTVEPQTVEGRTPVVMHAPTAPLVKGTAAVERAVAELGPAIDYRPLTGIPAAQMPQHVASADIVVDQLLLGSYGVAACEAMAAGRVVVGNVDDAVRAVVRERAGMDLPIVQADPDTLTDVLRRLISDPHERREQAKQGVDFVRAIHGGGQTRAVMADFLGIPGPEPAATG